MVNDKNYCKSYILSILTATLFATSNYLNGDISGRLGNRAIYAQGLAYPITWSIFHIKNYLNWRKKDEDERGVFFSKANSVYYKPIEKSEQSSVDEFAEFEEKEQPRKAYFI